MTTTLPTVVTTETFAEAELEALRLDGLLWRIGPGMYLPIDIPECAETRAEAVARAQLPERARGRLLPAGLTAAWVHGAVPRLPSVAEFATPADARFRPRLSVPHAIHEMALRPTDVCVRGGVRLLTPLRTLIDLAGATLPEADDATLRGLAEAAGLSLAECANEARRARGFAARRAASRIDAARRSTATEAPRLRRNPAEDNAAERPLADARRRAA